MRILIKLSRSSKYKSWLPSIIFATAGTKLLDTYKVKGSAPFRVGHTRLLNLFSAMFPIAYIQISMRMEMRWYYVPVKALHLKNVLWLNYDCRTEYFVLLIRTILNIPLHQGKRIMISPITLCLRPRGRHVFSTIINCRTWKQVCSNICPFNICTYSCKVQMHRWI